jgi:hypothetical protein
MGSVRTLPPAFILIICLIVFVHGSNYYFPRKRGGAASSKMRNAVTHPRKHLEHTAMIHFAPEKDSDVMEDVLACGDLCRYNKEAGWSPSPAQCTSAWLRMLSACPAAEWPPPKQPPSELLDAYTMGGRIPQKEWFFEQRYSGQNAMTPVWEPDSLNAAVAAKNITQMAVHVALTYGEAGAEYVESVLSKYSHILEGKVGIVWGSEKPWAEVLLARAGARHMTTVEYGRITSPHPRFSTVTPPNLAATMIANPRAWDFAFTYSSLEHSGLGRYGDALNPWGDMEAAVQTWCLLKPGGLFFLGLPCKNSCTEDELVWNAHRFYGPRRLAEMFAGYEHVETIFTDRAREQIEFASIIHVLRKPVD